MALSFPLIITVAVIIIFLLIFFHYVPFFLWINALLPEYASRWYSSF